MTDVSTTGVLSADHSRTTLQNFGRASLSDFFGDLVIYRNLEPLDRRIQGLKNAAYKMEISNDRIPRKMDRDYAKAAVWFAQQAQKKVRNNSTPIGEVLFIGDTLYNDGGAYKNMREVADLPGACFIGTEKPGDIELRINGEDAIYEATSWSALSNWAQWVLDQGLRVDEGTVVVVDIDKTALGAKGRNDHVINQARLEGIFRTMSSVLGDDFDRASFERQYAELNRSRYHFLTEDNQDYLAYICLVLNTGLLDYAEIIGEIASESLNNFEQFLRLVDSRIMSRPQSGESVRQVHETVIGAVRVGDPTPFKRFRRQEFITTMERMGNMPDNTPVTELLAKELTLTNEVCDLAEWLKSRGCLLLCLSDKPDEASCPDPRSENPLLPVHQAKTHRVGVSLKDDLAKLG